MDQHRAPVLDALAAFERRSVVASALPVIKDHAVALLILDGVILCCTGGEALYADMGHEGVVDDGLQVDPMASVAPRHHTIL